MPAPDSPGDYTAALALLTAQCQPTVYPTLDDSELQALLDATVGFSIWQADTAYSYGDIVMPTVRNGHLYQCLLAGTSGTSEPSWWPGYTNPDLRVGLTRPYWHGFVNPVPGSQVGDGSTIWIEYGPDSGSGYNVRLATYNAWLMKIAKASADYDVSLDGNTYNRSQVIATCQAMAQRYAPTQIF